MLQRKTQAVNPIWSKLPGQTADDNLSGGASSGALLGALLGALRGMVSVGITLLWPSIATSTALI